MDRHDRTCCRLFSESSGKYLYYARKLRSACDVPSRVDQTSYRWPFSTQSAGQWSTYREQPQFTHSTVQPCHLLRQSENFTRGAPQAAAISLIVHPCNPHVPTTHMNLRFFAVEAPELARYFGGGHDLTPCYPVDQDVVFWHQTAKVRWRSLSKSRKPAMNTFLCYRNGT